MFRGSVLAGRGLRGVDDVRLEVLAVFVVLVCWRFLEGGGIVEGLRGDFFMLVMLLSWLSMMMVVMLFWFDVLARQWRLVVLSRICPGSY